MSNGIKKLEKVWCSLNLGYVYNLSYSFAPKEGIKISLFFVNETGIYNTSFVKSPPTKVQIKIGAAVFNLFPVESSKTTSLDQKTCRVDFIDETFTLNNYYLALTGKGCGVGIYTLGRTVDNRTEAQKKAEDPDLFKIKEFTTFDDIEYNFVEFIDTLRKVYPVQVSATIDNTITRSYSGTFRSVLDNWCSYLGFGYFFDGGTLKIFDPNTLSITFPPTPIDAINLEESVSILNTYDRTAWNYFSDEGGEITISSNSNYLIKELQLYPIMDLFGLKEKQPSIAKNIDMNQLVAAQYGKEFWLLYNIVKGTADSVCGYDSTISSNQVSNSIRSNWYEALNTGNKSFQLALLNEKKFDENFQFYKAYGDIIQGRLYISNAINGIENFENFQWYDQGNGQIFNVDILKQQPSPVLGIFKRIFGETDGIIPNTEINAAYQGAIADGQRFFYFDQFKRNSNLFELSEDQVSSISFYYNNYTKGVLGNEGLDYADGFSYILHQNFNTLSTVINNLVDLVSSKTSYFSYRRNRMNLKGLAPLPQENKDFNPLNDTNITILNNTNGIISNVSTLKAYVDSNLVAFYAKYENCKSVSTQTKALNRQFFPRSISDDIPISSKYTKNSNGALEINRDFSYFDQISKSDVLSKIAKPYSRPREGKTFTMNYFDPNVPSSFILNGLVGINISIQQDGMSVTYNYSNEVLEVQFTESDLDKVEENMKNSWIKTYTPRRRLT